MPSAGRHARSAGILIRTFNVADNVATRHHLMPRLLISFITMRDMQRRVGLVFGYI